MNQSSRLFVLAVLLVSLFCLVRASNGNGNGSGNNNQPPPYSGNGNPDCTKPIDVVVDTDMGLDDITAVGMLLAHSVEQQFIRSNTQKVHILGIVTDDGIAYLANGTSNLLRILQRCGRAEIPVYAGEVLVNGSQGHIIKPFRDAWRPFMSALPGVDLPVQVDQPERESAAEYLVRISREKPGFSLISLGVLSNIANAMDLDPTFASRVGKLVMMGGAVYAPGNARPSPDVPYVAEWNLYVDQWATNKVFNSGAFSGKFWLAPLDVTNYWFWVNASAALVNIPSNRYTLAGAFMKNVMDVAIANNYKSLFDPCAVQLLLRPDLMTTQLIPLAAIPSGYNASALYVVSNPSSTSHFSWVRTALNLDIAGTQAWYACSVQGTCTH